MLGFILAILAFGLLVIVHELGHYWMARKEGMTVEVFSIGLGRAIKKWKINGVEWQLGWMPFGGYVRIPDMDGSDKELGVFQSSPWSRIKVAVMGPLFNLIFAAVLFTGIWFAGGRNRPFCEHTPIVGWVDESSSLYKSGLRPGDSIGSINNKPYHGFLDLITIAACESGKLVIKGDAIDYRTHEKTPYLYSLPLEKRGGLERAEDVAQLLLPASFLYYVSEAQNGKQATSQLREGDRLVAIDGEPLFSLTQLSCLLNEQKAVVLFSRDGQLGMARISRVSLNDLCLSLQQRADMEDLRHSANLKGRDKEVRFLPYHINADLIVLDAIPFLDFSARENVEKTVPRSYVSENLKSGDKIVSIDGAPVGSLNQLMQVLQQHAVQLVVNRGGNESIMPLELANEKLVSGLKIDKIPDLFLHNNSKEAPELVKLDPFYPLSYQEVVKDGALTLSETPTKEGFSDDSQLFLGIALEEQKVEYNPKPWQMMSSVIGEIFRTITALLIGQIHPKWMSGPIGIVRLMHHSWSISTADALFWCGTISINLALLNLLPIPVLDGGHICFSLWELITKQKIAAKTMEKIIFPFLVLLILFFAYVTVQDVTRWISMLFP